MFPETEITPIDVFIVIISILSFCYICYVVFKAPNKPTLSQQEKQKQEIKEEQTLEQKLYSMKVGDRIYHNSFYVNRVPGGWVYSSYQTGATFVPYVHPSVTKAQIIS